jgi:hypothetical protein
MITIVLPVINYCLLQYHYRPVLEVFIFSNYDASVTEKAVYYLLGFHLLCHHT